MQVAGLVAWCYERGRGDRARAEGAPGFAGGAVPLEGGVVVGLRADGGGARLRSRAAGGSRSRPGCRPPRSAACARESGLLFPPDPGAAEQSQIGGNIATNAGGPHAFKYGVTGALGHAAWRR